MLKRSRAIVFLGAAKRISQSLTQFTVALKLRLAEPLISRRFMRKAFAHHRVSTDVPGNNGWNTRLEIKKVTFAPFRIVSYPQSKVAGFCHGRQCGPYRFLY